MRKLLIITGANKGLGKAIVDLALIEEDTIIISLSRSLNKEHEKISNNKLIFLKTDLAESFSAENFKIINNYIDNDTILFLFNNAGTILPISKIGYLNKTELETSINVNVLYPVNLINYVINNFTDNSLVIVNITSGAGNKPIANWSLYCASKAFMKMFFNVLDEENKNNHKLKLYNLDPGTMDTEMQKNIRSSVFPNQDFFSSLKEDDKLIKPEIAALNIFNKIDYYL